eukprot:4032732-Prymnesium_polylepis.1
MDEIGRGGATRVGDVATPIEPCALLLGRLEAERVERAGLVDARGVVAQLDGHHRRASGRRVPQISTCTRKVENMTTAQAETSQECP